MIASVLQSSLTVILPLTFPIQTGMFPMSRAIPVKLYAKVLPPVLCHGPLSVPSRTAVGNTLPRVVSKAARDVTTIACAAGTRWVTARSGA